MTARVKTATRVYIDNQTIDLTPENALSDEYASRLAEQGIDVIYDEPVEDEPETAQTPTDVDTAQTPTDVDTEDVEPASPAPKSKAARGRAKQ